MKTTMILLGFALWALLQSAPVELFLNTVTPAQEPVLAQEMQHMMASQEIVRADFTQRKEVAALKTTLVTQGAVLYSAQDGVVWRVVSPYTMELVMTDSVIKVIQDSTTSLLDTKNFQLGRIQHLLGAIYTGDISRLSSLFSLYFVREGESWSLGLVPRKGRLKRLLSSIVVTGNDTLITSAAITSLDGGTTDISFVAADETHAPLTSDELELFYEK